MSKSKTEVMWETLVSTLTNIVDSQQTPQLELIFNMIKTNLTFDDPGLFDSKHLDTAEERLQATACNIWLFNQLTYITTLECFASLKKNNIELQKLILSASFLKQPWFFYDVIIPKIVDLLYLLNKHEIENVPEIKLFEVNDYDLSQIEASCSFKQIFVKTEKTSDDLIETCLHLISHVAGLVNESDLELRNVCTKVVFQILNEGILEHKTLSLMYFGKYLRLVRAVDQRLENIILNVLFYSSTIIANIPQWLEDEDVTVKSVDEFETALSDLFAKLNYYSYGDQTEHRNKVCTLSIKIIKNLFVVKRDDKILKLNLIDQIIKFLKNLDCIGSAEIEIIFSLIDYSPKIILLLESSILKDITQATFKNDDINKVSESWKQIYDRVMKSEVENWHDQIEFLQKTFLLCTNIVHNYTIWHQTKHLESNNICFCSNSTKNSNFKNWNYKCLHLKFFRGKLSLFVTRFLEKISQNKMNFEYFVAVTDISIDLCSLHEFKELDLNQQVQITSLILSPYKKDENNIPDTIKELFNGNELEELELKAIKMKTLHLVSNLNLKHFKEDSSKFLKQIFWKIIEEIVNSNDFGLKNSLLQFYLHLNVSGKYSPKQLFIGIFLNLIDNETFHQTLSKTLNNLLCLFSPNTFLVQVKDGYKIFCEMCKNYLKHTDFNNWKQMDDNQKRLNAIKNGKGVLISNDDFLEFDMMKKNGKYFVAWFRSEDDQVQINMTNLLPALIQHTGFGLADNVVENWTNLILSNKLETIHSFSNNFVYILDAVEQANIGVSHKKSIHEKCLSNLLTAVKLSLRKSDLNYQQSVLNMIYKYTTCSYVNEEELMHCIRLIIFYLMRIESEMTREAELVATEMCIRRDITPKSLLNWYQKPILKIIVAQSATNYRCYKISLFKSLVHITKLFRFSGPTEFVVKYYKIMLAMLLPWCIKDETCEALLDEIAQKIRKDKTVALSASFLTIYPYLFINESTEVTNKCIDFIIKNTGNTLYHLLHTDIKRTVSEILVHYHKNPECVMHAFRSLLSQDNSEISATKMAEYIARRFLGVLTFFEAAIFHPENEKCLKKETLLSLGEIIRLLGTNYITSFRFKIIAMLKTALSIEEPNLNQICVRVWKIFICTVDVEQLGPLLSVIFVTLEPLLSEFPAEINYIFRYLVVSNNHLLSPHIPSLFFLEDIAVDDEIKKIVSQQLKNDKDDFLGRFNELLKHINHENLSVRIFGLTYLKRLFVDNRMELNKLIVGQLKINPIIEKILDSFIKSCRDVDTNLQLKAAECMGELGALAPSHLPPNYSPQMNFALSIHTDSFAIMALKELCRAHQFQKDTKFMDNFSLAIQDILSEREVNPTENRKMEVWEAIPERLRPLMEPLLTSCYTGLAKSSSVKMHPIFGSSKANTCHDWAYSWAAKMIEGIGQEPTQDLLNSFKPSIKCDINTLALFLPYIILHALQFSTESIRNEIVAELNCVFDHLLKEQMDDDKLECQRKRLRAIRTVEFVPTKPKPQSETTAIQFKCAKLAFNQLDFLEKWKRQWRKVYALKSTSTEYLKVDKFLQEFDKKMLANANFKCNEYARALMYIESYIEENVSRLQGELSFLCNVYAKLNDPDSVEGVMSLKAAEPTLSEQILANNVTGRLNESAACYERMMQVGDISTFDIRNMVECYLGLDQPETALLVSESLLNKYYENNVKSLLQEIKAEPLWRLGRFEELEELLNMENIKDSESWGVLAGQLMTSFRKNNHEDFILKLDTTRSVVLKVLKNSELEESAYEKAYPQVLKLHMITEFEKCESVLNQFNNNEVREGKELIQSLIHNLNARLELLQPTAGTIEPIICLRRILLSEINRQIKDKEIQVTIDEQIGELWVKSTELASKANMFQQAHLYILNAESYKPKKLFLQKAKLFWDKRDTSTAFKILERGIGEVLESGRAVDFHKLENDDKKIYAEGKLMIAMYNAEAANIASELNLKYFKEAVQANPESEKSLVHLAQYLDKMYAAMSDEEQDTQKGWELLQEIMHNYGKSMNYGSSYIYQSMPRLLSIWLDFTTNQRKNEMHRKICTNMNKLAQRFSKELSPYFFFTAFSQLISRVSHPSLEVYSVLKSIIINLILNYPQQSLWMILSVFKSSYTSRVKRSMEIFNDKRLAQPELQKLIKDFNSLAEKFIELTNIDVTDMPKSNLFVSYLVKSLPNLLSKSNLSDIMMPIQKCMNLVLDKSSEKFQPYPINLVYIRGIRDGVTVLHSLQKPKKVTLVGNDGKEYFVMMKPKDDLRKDFRLMEFNAVVKQYLYQDPDARHRRLNIRTYAVLPLNEECGVIEWVSNLSTFRSILLTYYKLKGLGLGNKELKACMVPKHHSAEKKRSVFVKKLLPSHPPVFAEWFRDRFSNPHNWFQARSSYIKTTAVISIVGYILGLGDRHGENILFDGLNGDTVHVDFNCLFNKGESFDYPELVPFRLTQNMVKAMGPLGIEGLFRKCCEITLRVLQNQAPTLMSVLKPFVYDPLVTWSKDASKSDGNVERTDAEAKDNLKHIEDRLKGLIKINKKTTNMPLSIEGQINFIIAEAMDIDALAAMYIGWGAYM